MCGHLGGGSWLCSADGLVSVWPAGLCSADWLVSVWPEGWSVYSRRAGSVQPESWSVLFSRAAWRRSRATGEC